MEDKWKKRRLTTIPLWNRWPKKVFRQRRKDWHICRWWITLWVPFLASMGERDALTSNLMAGGVQPNPEPDQLEQPARTRTSNRPNQPLRQSVTGFRAQDLTPAGWVAGFLLQNLSHPTRPTLYTNPAICREIQPKFGEIRRHSSEIWWDPTTFEEIQARFGEIRRHSRRSKRDLDHIWWDPMRFEEIQADFGDFWCRSTEFLQILANFLKIPVTFAGSDDSLNRPNRPEHHPNPKLTQPSDAGGRFRVPLTSTRRRQVGSGMGPKPIRPDPLIALLMAQKKGNIIVRWYYHSGTNC